MERRINNVARQVQQAISIAKTAHAAYQSVKGAYQGARRHRSTRASAGMSASNKPIITVPIGRQAVASNFMATKFGQAAAHDDFPEGGLRIAGEMPNLSDDGLGVASTGTGKTGAFGPTRAASFTSYSSSVLGVSPTTLWSSSGSNATGLGLFGDDVTFGNVPLIAQYFRFFRFRRLWLVYEGEAASSTSGTVQFSYDRSLASLYSNITSTSPQIKAATSVVTRFPWFTTQGQVKLVEDMKSNKADRLYSIAGAGATLSPSESNADLELFFQGGIAGVLDNPSAAATLGRYRWKFVLDLYGFSSQIADAALTRREERRISRLKEDLVKLKLLEEPSGLSLSLDVKEDSKKAPPEDGRDAELASVKKKLAEAEKTLKNSVLIVDSHIPAGVTPAKLRTS